MYLSLAQSHSVVAVAAVNALAGVLVSCLRGSCKLACCCVFWLGELLVIGLGCAAASGVGISASVSIISLNTLTLNYLLIFGGVTGVTGVTSPSGAACSCHSYVLCRGDRGDKYLSCHPCHSWHIGRGDTCKPRGTRLSPVSPVSLVK